MNLQRNLRVMWLVVTAFGMSAGAALITNNVTNWNGVTNTVTGGRWSYLDVIDMNSTSTNVALATKQYGSAQDNWCLDNTNTNNDWLVQSNGAVVTDNRAMGWAYTAGSTEGGPINIKGYYGLNSGSFNFDIYKTTDTDMSRVDMSAKQLLFSASAPATFNLNTTLQPGNDIVFVSNTTDGWWVARSLDATITIPEPAALSLLALGGLVLFRRRR